MNADRLKLLMMGLMIPSHIGYFVSPEWALVFHVITYCVGVFFGYTAVEGSNYTRSVCHYDGRLCIWAAIMFAGNTLLNYLVNSPAITTHNNIFSTLALDISMLIVTKAMLEMPKTSLKIALLISILAILGIGAVFAEGGVVTLPFMLIMYLVGKRLVLWNCLYGALMLSFLVTSSQWLGGWPTAIEMLAYNSDSMFIIVLPSISLHSGERESKAPFFKYLFYGFHPPRLWLIALMANYVHQTFLY